MGVTKNVLIWNYYLQLAFFVILLLVLFCLYLSLIITWSLAKSRSYNTYAGTATHPRSPAEARQLPYTWTYLPFGLHSYQGKSACLPLSTPHSLCVFQHICGRDRGGKLQSEIPRPAKPRHNQMGRSNHEIINKRSQYTLTPQHSQSFLNCTIASITW